MVVCNATNIFAVAGVMMAVMWFLWVPGLCCRCWWTEWQRTLARAPIHGSPRGQLSCVQQEGSSSSSHQFFLAALWGVKNESLLVYDFDLFWFAWLCLLRVDYCDWVIIVVVILQEIDFDLNLDLAWLVMDMIVGDWGDLSVFDSMVEYAAVNHSEQWIWNSMTFLKKQSPAGKALSR